MNAHDPNLEGLAQLHYGDGDYVVLKPGRFVVCAVTGRQIPLDALRYWSIDLQEAYVGPGELMERAAAA
ncbi:MAG: DUF2093 domain-containing protein [Brevundimonas sp.]|uniref:DUF2093 domain-containing protein n=1 Tax=Brevundimonas sp. TaxID=1871086 RepID=UPI00391D7EE3